MNSSLRDERLPKGPRFASESLDADSGVGQFSLTYSAFVYPNILLYCSGTNPVLAVK